MKLLDDGAPNPRGDALLAELRWIHDIIRSNLAAIAAVVEQISAGAPIAQVRAQIDDLATTSVVWTLRVNCMRYCSLVHGHHHHEDAAWFPALRHVNPELHSVIDKLEADHVIKISQETARFSGAEEWENGDTNGVHFGYRSR